MTPTVPTPPPQPDPTANVIASLARIAAASTNAADRFATALLLNTFEFHRAMAKAAK